MNIQRIISIQILLILFFQALHAQDETDWTLYQKPMIEFEKAKVGEGDVYYQFIGNYKAVVWLFHDFGEREDAWLTDPEKVKFVNDLLTDGYGVVIPVSANRDEKMWQVKVIEHAKLNEDLKQLERIKNFLRHDKIVGQGAYHVAVGYGNGGDFAALAAKHGHFSAVALYNTPGLRKVIFDRTYVVPTMFIYGEKDITPGSGGLETKESYNELTRRNESPRIFMHFQHPLDEQYLRRVSGLDEKGIKKFLKGLYKSGFTDKTGEWLKDPSADKSWVQALDREYYDLVPHIGQVLDAAYAGHAFTSAFSKETMDFFRDVR